MANFFLPFRMVSIFFFVACILVDAGIANDSAVWSNRQESSMDQSSLFGMVKFCWLFESCDMVVKLVY